MLYSSLPALRFQGPVKNRAITLPLSKIRNEKTNANTFPNIQAYNFLYTSVLPDVVLSECHGIGINNSVNRYIQVLNDQEHESYGAQIQ